jgi:hypothetical protein
MKFSLGLDQSDEKNPNDNIFISENLQIDIKFTNVCNAAYEFRAAQVALILKMRSGRETNQKETCIVCSTHNVPHSFCKLKMFTLRTKGYDKNPR